MPRANRRFLPGYVWYTSEALSNRSSRSKPHDSSMFKGSTFNDHTRFLIFRITLCSERAPGYSPWRKKAAGKGKEEEMKYTVPGNSPPLR
jgi:hypothetical protein